MTPEPFIGLRPFSEEDAEYFCGRDEDVEAVTNMLMVHRLTILHGVAGVGKTSFLRAGVAHAMNQEAERNQERWGSRGLGIVVFPRTENEFANEWLNEPMGKLKNAILEQIRAVGVDCPSLGSDVSLGEFLKAIAARLKYPQGIGQLYLVLDQFEEYLHGGDARVEKAEFLRSLAKVINTPEVPVHFLVALQSSDLGKLQQLEELIRRLWDYRYELKNLDKKAASQAILRPIKVFNSKRSVDQGIVTLEPGLSFVKQLLKDLNEQSHDRSGPRTEWSIEAAYLQIVMQRLWQQEGIPGRSHVIRQKTYESLKRTQGIIQEHVDQTMAQLDQAERDAVARSLRQLLLFAKPVRIDELVAHSKVAKKDWQPELGKEQVQRLFDGPLVHDRILRPLADGEYECFLPTLGKPLGDWVCRQQRLDGLAEELASAEAMFKRSQLDGLRQAEEAVSFVLQEVQHHNVSDRDVPTPLLIGTLKSMLNQVTESRRITDPDSPLNSMSYSPDGKWFAAASFNGRIHLLNRENGEERTIEDRDGGVLYVALGPDERVALASGHGYARIFDFDKGLPRQFPKKSAEDPFHSVAFSADGKLLATGSMDSVARIWDIDGDGSRCIAECHGHELTIHHVAFSPTRPILLTASWDGTVRLWDCGTGKQRCVYRVPEQGIYHGSFNSRGDQVVTVCWMSGLAHVWNLDDEKPLREFQIQKLVSQICFHDPEGQRVATASWDGTARIWNLKEQAASETESYDFVPGPMFRAFFRPNGHELATNQWDGVVHLWTLAKSQQAKGHGDPNTVVETPGNPQMFARFSQSGDKIAVAGFDKKIRLYSLTTDPSGKSGVKPDPLEQNTFHSGPLYCVAFDPRRTNRLATSSYDRTGRLWSLDGNQLVLEAELTGHKAQIHEIAFSPREELVATASGDGSVRFWSLSGAPGKCFKKVGLVYSVKFHPKKSLVASAWGDGFVRLIDLKSGDQIGEYRIRGSTSPAFCVDFSDDGRFLGAVFENGYACVWECCDDSPDKWLASEPRRPPFQVHEGLAMGIAFSPTPTPSGSEPWFATSSGDGFVRLWSLNGRMLAESKLHKTFVRSIDFHPDPANLRLLTASVDASVKLFNIDRSMKSLQDLHRQARQWLGDRPAAESLVPVPANKDWNSLNWGFRP